MQQGCDIRAPSESSSDGATFECGGRASSEILAKPDSAYVNLYSRFGVENSRGVNCSADDPLDVRVRSERFNYGTA